MQLRRIGRNLFHVTAALALLSVLIPGAARAGTTGKIAGRIVEKKSKQPLEGVNVAIPAAHTGAVTDADGRFAILNLPAGAYDVKVSLLGYRVTTVTGVVVSSDNTTPLDLPLEEAPVAMDEVVVSAQRPVVDLKLTSNMAAVDRAQINSLPVQELADVVNLQAGVVDGHFRGGRIGEVQYQVDGVSVNNAYDNKSSLRIDRSLLEEVQVISGTFDAEYGQAMSGVVNAVLRRGTEQFRWDAELMDGGFLFAGGARRALEYEFNPGGTQNYQLSLSGPTGLPRTYFLLSGRRYQFDDYVMAEKRFSPWAIPDSVRGGNSSMVYKVLHPDGSGKREPLAYSREWSGVGKLTNRSLKSMEFNYQAVWNVVDARPMTWAMRLNPDGISKRHTFSVSHGLDLTHTLSHKTYYSLSFRQNYFDYHDRLYDRLGDPRYDAAGQTFPADSTYEYNAVVQGVQFTRFVQKSDTRVIKGSFVAQITRDQQFKVGGELQWPQITFGNQGTLAFQNGRLTRHLDEPPFYPASRQYRPYQAAMFAQDEFEWNDLRLRGGLRFDYFNARASQPSDLANPANDLTDQPLSHAQAASRKTSVSPRFGVSYPVTRDAALFFAYGHFFQMPAIGTVFENADFGRLKGIQAATDLSSTPVMGNPDIRPEQTVQYQFGYKQALAEWLGMDLTVFYKDIRDLIGVEIIETYNGAIYGHLTNVDFGNVIGVTLTLDQRRRGLLSTSLDYTWQSAIGNSSDPKDTYTRAAAGEDPLPRQVPFNWDQRHTLNGTVTLSKDKDYALSTIVRIASGQPYTPNTTVGFGAGLESNSGRKPISMVVDVRGEKQVQMAGARGSVFLRVFNALDSRFFNGDVFSTSGDPYYTRFPGAERDQLANPTRYYAPRRVEVGLTVGVGE